MSDQTVTLGDIRFDNSAPFVLLGGVNGVVAFLTGPTIGEVALLLLAILLLRLMPRGITGRFFRKSL